MQGSSIGKMLFILALLALMIAAGFWFFTSNPQSSEQSPSAVQPGQQAVQRQDAYIPPVRASGHVEPAAEDIGTPAGPKLPAISHEQIEAYLKLHGRNAASLLAAFHASGGDTNLLKEAALNFPDDPHVQFTVLAQDLFPDDRRKWLDAFKQSSPDNSLANYLSALEYFDNNQSDAALKELSTALGKEQFSDFDLENFQSAADLYQFSGLSTLEVNSGAMTAMSTELIPLLGEMKRVAVDIRDLQKQYVDSGDTASVENLSQLELGLADRFSSGDGGRFMINQLVGMAIESNALRPLDQSKTYDFLDGETPTQRLAELKQEKTDMIDLMKAVPRSADMSEAQQNGYFDKMRTDGEIAAKRWFQHEYPNIAPETQ